MNVSIDVILASCLLIIVLRFAKRANEVKRERESQENNLALKPGEAMPYRKKYLLTKSEYKFYLVLKEICDHHQYQICPKVGLKELANVTSKDNYYHWFYKISAKHVDFVITDHNLKPFKAIELDDKSHRRSEVRERDKFKNEFFETIQLPLVRFGMDYTRDSIEAALFPDTNADILHNH